MFTGTFADANDTQVLLFQHNYFKTNGHGHWQKNDN